LVFTTSEQARTGTIVYVTPSIDARELLARYNERPAVIHYIIMDALFEMMKKSLEERQ